MWTMVRGGRGLPLRLRGLFVDVVTRVCSAARARHPHSGSTARRVSRREGATASVQVLLCVERGRSRHSTFYAWFYVGRLAPNPVRSAFAHGTRNDKSRTGRARGRVARDDELRQTQTAGRFGSLFVYMRFDYRAGLALTAIASRCRDARTSSAPGCGFGAPRSAVRRRRAVPPSRGLAHRARATRARRSA